jgi:hypothetical protein
VPPQPQQRTSLDKIIRAVRNDPQKAGILTVLFAILLVLQVRLQMSRGDGATRANAASPRALGAGGNNNGRSGNAGPVHAVIRPHDATSLREWMDADPAPLARNLFAVDLEKFPQDGSSRPAAEQRSAQVSPGFWDELAKSMSVRADVRKERQILVENLSRQASQLRLQTTMMGASPKAVIDGELVGEGDVVASFRVLKIEPRRIIVEREGIKLEIQMK